jgi:formylmethanofuran dehydrogenase subunit A
MRCFISTDHPNAGPFTRYPRVIKWLMSRKARDAQIKAFKNSDKVISATDIANLDREISLYELAAMTRAGPAQALGLAANYGGLAPGMNADVAVYNLNPAKMPTDPEGIEKAFSAVAYLFKDGKMVVKDGQVIDHGQKKTFWVDVKVKENRQVMHDVREKFLRYYSVNEGNYLVPDSYAPHPYVIAIDATS